MKKIASPQDLQTEIRRLMALCQEDEPSREKLASEIRNLADRLAGSAYDQIVEDKRFLPKNLSKFYAQQIKKRTKKPVRVVKSETTLPKGGWDYGNYTVLDVGGVNVAITIRFATGETRGNASADYAGTIAMARSNSPDQALSRLISEISTYFEGLS